MPDWSRPMPNPEFDLPVIRPPTGSGEPATPTPRRPLRAVLLHVARIALFVTTLAMIRVDYQRQLEKSAAGTAPTVTLFDVWKFFPDASAVFNSTGTSREKSQAVLNADGRPLGYVVQTSPGSDSIIGFSGPTNVLIAFDGTDRVVGVEILWSRDTREHVDMILADGRLLAAWTGLTWEELAVLLSNPQSAQVDAVSGATLTSLAIAESVALRLTGDHPASLRFPDNLTINELREFHGGRGTALAPAPDVTGMFDVVNASGIRLGRALRTSPAADSITGYQGPTDTLIALDDQDRVLGIRIRKSFDSEDPEKPGNDYVGYVRDDDYFLNLFNGKTLVELATLDLIEAQVEGISGATMTSMAVAEGIVAAARSVVLNQTAVRKNPDTAIRPKRSLHFSWQTLATAAIVVVGLFPGVIRRGVSRRLFQFAVIVLLGIVNGDLVSQAVLIGWTQNGIPWRLVPGLAIVVAAALLVPMISRRQPYCQHICPHGAVQQILIHRIRWQWKMPRRVHLTLSAVPFLLLLAVVVIPLSGLPLSLVDLEPFDAWVIGLAGVAAATIAIVGLVASLFVPMAYCRYGCPTGALLQFLRFHGRSDRLSIHDAAAAVLTLVAAGLAVFD